MAEKIIDEQDEFSSLHSLPNRRPPPLKERHPNGVTVAEAIDRIDSAFLATTGNIAAIDFGTANCSLAYCTIEDEEVTLLKLSKQEGQVRVPTALLINENGEPVKFGDRAIREYDRLDPILRKKYHLFERIKLALAPQEEITRDTRIADINGEMFFLRDVIALFIQHLKEELESCFQKLNINLTATDFHWVITVPAIWSASGKQMMREAAYQAGLCGSHNIERIVTVTRSSHIQPLDVNCPESLSLALEPEAASFYCRTMKQRDIVEFSNRQAGIPKTNNYVVVDIGGGTADFSAHGLTSEGNIEVLTPPEGNLSGGNAVNQVFENFLTQLVNDPGFSTYLSSDDDAEHKLSVRSIVYEEFEEEKKEFGQTDPSKYSNDTIFKVQLSDNFYEFYKENLKAGVSKLNLVKYDRRVTLGRRKTLCIHYSKMEEFFDGPISNILATLKDILKRLNNDIRTIFLVGGFGGCQYMYYRVKEELILIYGDEKFRIIVPNSPHLAVVEGAFQYCKNPKLISSRIAEATYGTEAMVPFDKYKHDEDYSRTMRSGEKLCTHLFSPLIIEGERVGYNQVKINKYRPADPLQTSVMFNLVTSDNKNLFYTRSPNGFLKEGVKILGTITLPSPDIDKSDRDIYLTYDFSHTEIQVHAYDESSCTERRAVIDCLTKRGVESIVNIH